MTLTQKVRNIVSRYWVNSHTLDITDHACVTEVEKMFKDCGINYAINKYLDHGPGYEITYYVFSWVEDGKLQTFDLTIENYDYEEELGELEDEEDDN